MQRSETNAPAPPFAELELTPAQRRQVEAQLVACFDLTPEAARTWVGTTARSGVCFGRVERDGVIAASYAAEALTLARGDERLGAVMLQSCYVHPGFRGRGYGLARADVDALRRRFAADVVVLTLFDDGLVPYWRRRGFSVVQRAEVISLATYVRRAATAFTPALTAAAAAAKVAENLADGAVVEGLPFGEAGGDADAGVLLIRAPGDDVADELIVRRLSGLRLPHDPAGAAGDVRLRLKTVMASPGSIDLVCPIDL